MHPLIHWISDMLWPLACLGCAKRGIRLCRSCVSELTGDEMLRRRPTRNVDRILDAGSMRNELLSRAIWNLKYRNAPDLAGPLTDLIATAAGRSGVLPARDSVVAAVPLHPRRERERGYNQAELLARRLSAIAMLPYLPGALTRTRHTPAQVETPDRASRFENMENAFACALPKVVRGRAVLLVDDVSTTGATIEAAARALKDAGARFVTGIVLARG